MSVVQPGSRFNLISDEIRISAPPREWRFPSKPTGDPFAGLARVFHESSPEMFGLRGRGAGADEYYDKWF